MRIRPAGSGWYHRDKGSRDLERIRADVGDLDADRAAVGDRRMLSALLDVERLVDRAVQVEHEVDAQPTHILQDLKAALAGSSGVEVDDELVDHFFQQRKVPASPAYSFNLLLAQALEPHSVTVGVAQTRSLTGSLGRPPSRLIEWSKPALDPVGVIAARIGPQHDPCRGVIQLSADHDLIAPARQLLADLGARLVREGRGDS